MTTKFAKSGMERIAEMRPCSPVETDVFGVFNELVP